MELARPHEKVLSDNEFVRCLSNSLSRALTNGSKPADTIPFLIIPVTMDVYDLKHLFCNITAPISKIMLINNGNFSVMEKLVDLVKLKLAEFVDRQLFITHHRENTGYSGAINEGLRKSLEFPIKEVPWVLICNADVRFSQDLFPKMTAIIEKETAADGEIMASLQTEVDEENAEVANGSTSKFDNKFAYHSSEGNIVTSQLLPKRIRMMSDKEMQKQFKEHYGIFYPSHSPDMAAFVLTRLIISTVGFFDENYFPAYGEDDDFRWRAQALGFKSYNMSPGLFRHYNNANLRAALLADNLGIFKSRTIKKQFMQFKRMNYQPFRLSYRRLKWFPGMNYLDVNEGREPLPFKGSIPVDMWILDHKRYQSIRDVGEAKICNSGYSEYNSSLLESIP